MTDASQGHWAQPSLFSRFVALKTDSRHILFLSTKMRGDKCFICLTPANVCLLSRWKGTLVQVSPGRGGSPACGDLCGDLCDGRSCEPSCFLLREAGPAGVAPATPLPVQSLLLSALAAWGPVSPQGLCVTEGRRKPCHVTRDADFTGLSALAATAHGLAMGSVSLEATATLRPQAQDRQLTLMTKDWTEDLALRTCWGLRDWASAECPMTAVSMCTLKFYLYCKENKKGPNLGPGGRGQTTGVSGCAPCGLCSDCRWPRPTQRGPGFCAKTKPHPSPSPHPR